MPSPLSQTTSRFRLLQSTISMVALALSPSAFATGETATEWPAQWIAARDVPLNPPKGPQYIPQTNAPGRFNSPTKGGLGYHAVIADNADTAKWVQVDLGSVKPLESVRMRAPDHEDTPGFGFPLRYRVEISSDNTFSQPVMLVDHTSADVPNPGAKVLEIDGQGRSGRFVRITGTRLFARPSKPSEHCFALRSLEVMTQGKNIARDAVVSALDSVEAHGWGIAHLTDASTPPVAPRREAVMMRRDIVLAQKPTRALARVAGMGLVDFMINGRKAGDRVMAPALTDFTKRAYFDTYDVTDLLREGNNTLAALLGNGHYAAPGRGWNSWFGVGNDPVASVDLEITLADGTIQKIGTDSSWKWSTGEIVFNDFFAGETQDLRLAQAGWNQPGFDDSKWQEVAVVAPPPGKLLPNPCPPVRVTSEVKPIRVEGNKYIFDAMFTGWPSVRVRGVAGQVVRITGSADYQFTLKGGGEEILEPRFVIQTIGPEITIEGIAPPPADAVSIKRAHADLRRTGDFSCSDPFLNNVYQVFLRTHQNYTFDFPWDPTREKAGWTQDVQTMFDSAAYSTDMQAVYTRWWRDFHDNQTPDGAVGSVIPLPWGGQEHIWNDPWWSGMIIYTPWKLYQFYGDQKLLTEAYEPMRAYFTWLSAKAEPDGILRWAGASDWIEVGIDGWGPPKRTPTFLVSTCAWYLYADILRQTATILGETGDAAHYAQIGGKIRDSFNAKYFNSATGFYANATDSQTALILPLALGMVPDAQRPLVIQRLRENIEKWKGHLSTGFVGTPYLLETLADLGLAELSHTICTRQDYAGWNTLIKHGVMMETWNGGMAQMPSLGGSIGQWFFRTLGGIRPAAPGFKEILIKPSIVGDLTYVNTWHDCPHGRIVSNWNRSGDQLEMAVTIPAGTTAIVEFPQAKTNITKSGAGIVQFADTPIHTGITTVTEGVLRMGNGGKPVGLAETNELVVAQGALLDLNYPGTHVIGGLTYNGALVLPGTYDSKTSPEFIKGSGTLTVKAGQAANHSQSNSR